jgi:hypothetical protein
MNQVIAEICIVLFCICFCFWAGRFYESISTAKSHWLDSVEIAYLRELLANRNITALSREELKKEMGL